MLRIPITERPDWRSKAKKFGFHFHTMYGQPYWDESAYYQFSLAQIEHDIEDVTAELHQMCLAAVDVVTQDHSLLRQFQIPDAFWPMIRRSWSAREPSLYSRLDLAYDGKKVAKLYENNADTPTSLYETGFWQWLWLADQVDVGRLSRRSDQFNSLQDKLIRRFHWLKQQGVDHLHVSCCKDTEEDRGTVQYLQDCALEAGIQTHFVYIEDIGVDEAKRYVDTQNRQIQQAFKLYPWEYMMREEFGRYLNHGPTRWIEPPWKSILSNKAILPLLWQMYPNHPNLLPAYFTEKEARQQLASYVVKPLFSREGANVQVIRDGEVSLISDGPYGAEGYIYQAWHSLPVFGDNYTLIGSWLVDDQPAGISVREDRTAITRDLSRFLPHIIL